ncbi:MAG: hypothetical protein ABIU87_08340 [Ornithinibacter sp.]
MTTERAHAVLEDVPEAVPREGRTVREAGHLPGQHLVGAVIESSPSGCRHHQRHHVGNDPAYPADGWAA